MDAHVGLTKHLPRNVDGSREIAVLLVALGAIASFALVTTIDSLAWMLVANAVLWCAVLGVGLLFLRFLNRRAVRKAAADAEDFTSMMEKETARKLAEAKASGAFDRFGPDSRRER